MNGSEAVEKMRRKPDLESVPVIAVTASSLLPESGNARHRFNGYLRKPFSQAELYREIAQIIPRITGPGREKLPDIPPEVPDSEAHAAAWQTAIRKLHLMEASSWAALRNSLAITEAIRSGRPAHGSFSIRAASGERATVEASAFPIVASPEGSSGAMILFWPLNGNGAS